MSTSDRTYHHGDVPERILDAARALLERMPVADVSVRELARTAGVSHAAPYRHFGDRAGFTAALAARCFQEFIDAQRVAFDVAPPGQRLLRVGLAYVDYATDHPFAFALIFDPAMGPDSGPDMTHGHQSLIDTHATLLSASIDDAIDDGQLSGDAAHADLGGAMWSAAHGLAALVTSGRIDRATAPSILSALLHSSPRQD